MLDQINVSGNVEHLKTRRVDSHYLETFWFMVQLVDVASQSPHLVSGKPNEFAGSAIRAERFSQHRGESCLPDLVGSLEHE